MTSDTAVLIALAGGIAVTVYLIATMLGHERRMRHED
jgi:hypothetical protein